MLEHTGINCWLWSRVGIWAVPRGPCNLWGCSSLLQWFKIIRLNVEWSCFGHHVGWRTGRVLIVKLLVLVAVGRFCGHVITAVDGERRGTEARRIEGFRMDGQGDLNDLFVLSKELICI